MVMPADQAVACASSLAVPGQPDPHLASAFVVVGDGAGRTGIDCLRPVADVPLDLTNFPCMHPNALVHGLAPAPPYEDPADLEQFPPSPPSSPLPAGPGVWRLQLGGASLANHASGDAVNASFEFPDDLPHTWRQVLAPYRGMILYATKHIPAPNEILVDHGLGDEVRLLPGLSIRHPPVEMPRSASDEAYDPMEPDSPP